MRHKHRQEIERQQGDGGQLDDQQNQENVQSPRGSSQVLFEAQLSRHQARPRLACIATDVKTAEAPHYRGPNAPSYTLHMLLALSGISNIEPHHLAWACALWKVPATSSWHCTGFQPGTRTALVLNSTPRLGGRKATWSFILRKASRSSCHGEACKRRESDTPRRLRRPLIAFNAQLPADAENWTEHQRLRI